MPIVKSKDEYNEFGSLLSRYRAALGQLRQWGVRIAANSRLRAYETRLAAVDPASPRLVPEAVVVQFAVDLREINEVIDIVASFDAEPTPAELALLKRIAGGSEHPDDERGSSSREAQFELMMRVFLKARGLDIRVGNPDLTITHAGKQYPFEAKRPGSAARFDERLREGANQIASKNAPGIVAISMDEVLRPSGSYLRIKDRRLLAPAVQSLVADYVSSNIRAISKRVAGKNVSGVLFSTTLPVLEEAGELALMGVSQHFEIVAEPTSDGHALAECFREALRS